MQEPQEMWVWSLGREDPLEKETATPSSMLAWENPMDRGPWQAEVHRVTQSQTWLSDWTYTHTHTHTHTLHLTFWGTADVSSKVATVFYIATRVCISPQTCQTCYCLSFWLLLSHFSRVRLCATPQTAAHQSPPSLGFSRQEHWSGLPFPSPMHESEKWKWSRSVMSDS